jgi:hypothetical protein
MTGSHPPAARVEIGDRTVELTQAEARILHATMIAWPQHRDRASDRQRSEHDLEGVLAEGGQASRRDVRQLVEKLNSIGITLGNRAAMEAVGASEREDAVPSKLFFTHDDGHVAEHHYTTFGARRG